MVEVLNSMYRGGKEPTGIVKGVGWWWFFNFAGPREDFFFHAHREDKGTARTSTRQMHTVV